MSTRWSERTRQQLELQPHEGLRSTHNSTSAEAPGDTYRVLSLRFPAALCVSCSPALQAPAGVHPWAVPWDNEGVVGRDGYVFPWLLICGLAARRCFSGHRSGCHQHRPLSPEVLADVSVPLCLQTSHRSLSHPVTIPDKSSSSDFPIACLHLLMTLY